LKRDRPPLKPGDVYPAHVLRDEYGMNAANRPIIHVDAAEVPESLRDLIPLVERWAIPCDVTRGDYFAHQPEEDVARFWHDVLPRAAAINAWLDSLSQNVQRWPAAAVHFMYFLKAHSEAWQPTPEEKKEIERRRSAWEHGRALKDAVRCGDHAFKAQDYPAVVHALEPFAAELGPVMAHKLAYARKKITG
jgi:hypothetical protein